MTQLTNEHFELHSANKDRMHKAKKFGVALAGLNNQINRLIALTPTDEQVKLDQDGVESLQIAVNPKYLQEQLNEITDSLTDVLVDLKMETGVDV